MASTSMRSIESEANFQLKASTCFGYASGLRIGLIVDDDITTKKLGRYHYSKTSVGQSLFHVEISSLVLSFLMPP